ncbi:calcium-activated potassium channel subunit beta-2 [Sardina pilchardus]|uniref:calcium-activated potassium channel subunit beta-2 n=1 Tax=Sardina pilchardus TaxID=27697 RepID=UPI002E0EB447
MHQRSFRQTHRSPSSSQRQHHLGGSGKMFFVAGNKAGQSSGSDKKSIYQKFRGYELMDKRRTETALKAGEDRAIFLGLSMMLCSVMMYFLLGITMMRSYAESVWTEETVCTVLNSTIMADINCSYSCGVDCWRSSKFPCLQVYVSVNASDRVALLSHNEDALEENSECFYVPKCQKEQAVMHALIADIGERLRARQQVPCFHDPLERREAVLLTQLYGRGAVFQSLFWPSCMLAGGVLIILMVKLTQYLSILCEQIGKISK